jgi:2-hydroxychromene-2-carboxylate isomerase
LFGLIEDPEFFELRIPYIVDVILTLDVIEPIDIAFEQKIDFYFDFASPNAYLSHKVMQSIKERTGAEINYIPVLLGGIFKLTNNKPPMEQFFGIKNKNEYQNLEMQRFIKRHGLEKFQMNPHFPVISLQIIRGAVAADMDGYLEDYIDKVLVHMWEEPKKNGRSRNYKICLRRVWI